MQIIAMLTMLIDHVGVLYFQESEIWRIIGRIAFPLYAYGIVQGFDRTKNRRKYFNRLLMLASISQLPFMFGLQVIGINVIATFVICLGILIVWEVLPSKWAKLGITAAAFVILEALPFDYGAYALLLILTYRFIPRNYWIATHMALNAAIFFYQGWEIQIFSIVPTVFLVYAKHLRGIGMEIRVPRWLWRGFYPGHLFILAMATAITEVSLSLE